MRILVTGSGTFLGRALAARLAQTHDVRTLDDAGASATPSFAGDARDRDFASRAVQDCDALVHLPLVEPAGRSELERIDRATRATYNLLTTGSNLKRVVLVSSFGCFERYAADMRVTETWAPRPTTRIDDLEPFLAEATVREVARVAPFAAVCLRLGEVVDDGASQARQGDQRWLHVEDALAAVERALVFQPVENGPKTGWWVYHIVGAGPRTRFPLGAAGTEPFSWQPSHDLASALPWPPVDRSVSSGPRVPQRPCGDARKVVIYGAGGPLAAVTTAHLVHDHVLRLTDIRPIADIAAEAKAQSVGAPLPRPLPPPHESRVVDVTDQAAVTDAADGMDAIINCTVMRPHPVEAFRVNTLGAYTVMRAAVTHGIRRVVHTGPQQVTLPYPAGYWYDFALDDDVPSRPGASLYILTKFLGHEITRLFAEEHGLEVPTLYFSSFVNPETPAPEPLGAFPFSVSWEDSALAMRLALRVPSLPRPFEVFHIVGDMPHGKYTNDKAKRLLGWQPRDRLEAHWRRTV